MSKEKLNPFVGERLPSGWERKPPIIDEIPKGVYIVQCDAGYKNGITGISTLVRTAGKEYKPQDYSRRNEGPIHAELSAICIALKRLKNIRQPVKVCIVYTDCKYAYYFLRELWVPRRDYIQEIINNIIGEINGLEDCGIEVFICHTKSTSNKRIDRRAGKKRKEEENRKRAQIDERIERVERAIIASRKIVIYEKGGEYFAISESGASTDYKVSLVPLQCECPWWTHQWGNKAQYIVKARALPCKHICALAGYLDKGVYQLFGLQIGRMD